MDNKSIIENNEIDLIQFIKTCWTGRRLIIISIVVFGFVGLVYSFLASEKYSASAVILPSNDSKVGSLGGLSALAGMAGINISSMLGQGEGFEPTLIPKIAESTPYLLDLMGKKILWSGSRDSLSFYDYYELENSKESIGNSILKYTVRLPYTLKDVLSPKVSKPLVLDNKKNGYYELSEKQILALDNLSSKITVDYQKSTGLIRVSATLSDPLAVAQLTQNAIELLQKYIVQYKIKKIADNLSFLEKRCEEKRMEYEAIQNTLMDYKDSNRNRIQERTDFEYQKLSDSYEIISSVYKGLVQSIEQSRIAIKEETPVFSVIMPVVVPINRDFPKRTLLILGMFTFGGFFGIGLLFLLRFSFRKLMPYSWTEKNRFALKVKQLCGIS